MDIEQRLLNHYKRWNIEFDQEKQFSQLKNRIILLADELLGEFLVKHSAIDKEFDKELTFVLAKEIELESSKVRFNNRSSIQRSLTELRPFTEGLEFESTFGITKVYKAIKEAENLVFLVTALQVLFWILEKHECPYHIEFAERLREVVKLTPAVSFCVAIRGKFVTLYPPGAELLDQGTVNDVLAWLENYPEVAKHLEEALKIYMDGDIGKYRNLLDNLRFALEQLLKEVIGNKKSLENQQKELLSWLKQREIHQEVVNLYNQLLFGQYCMYQNDAVKHNESFSENEIEFMIYLTGTFMRLLLQLA
jgi:hypothetical protein